VVPSLRAVPISQNKFPKLLSAEWVATNCTMIGDITCGKHSSFYHGVTLRGDTCKITIGSKTVIQDNTIIINSEVENPHAEVLIGDKVLIGVNCLLDSCRVDDNAFISNGVTINKGCHVQAGAVIAAGSVVPAGTVIPTGQIFAGNPAKYLRDLKPEEIVALSENLIELRELANVMVEHTEKSHFEFINDFDTKNEESQQSYYTTYKNKAEKYGYWMDATKKDDFGIEGASGIDGLSEWENEGVFKYTHTPIKQDDFDLNYEQDMTNYPDVFKKYNQNYERAEDLRKKFESEVPGESPGWPDHTVPPQRPGAMRAWVSKWDPDYNVKFRQVSNQIENRTL